MSRMSRVLAILSIMFFGLGLMANRTSAAVTLPFTQDWDSVYPWNQVYSGSALDSTQSAPGSASTSLKFSYPSGMFNGTAPDKVWIAWTPQVTEVWTQYCFKYSSNFYFHTVMSKQVYWYISGSSTNWFIGVDGSRHMQMQFQRSGTDQKAGSRYPNTIYNPTIQRDTWYNVTTRAVLNATDTASGIFQLWINDQLVMKYSDIKYLTGTDIGKKTGSMAFDPVFGGNVQESKPATDYFWVDHTIISTEPLELVPPSPTKSGLSPQPPSKLSIS
jgi:hypothetical protein